MQLKDFLSIALILVTSLLIGLVLMQVRGTGFGAALGGQDYTFRTKRGLQQQLHRLTIGVAVLFIAIAMWAVVAN
ncbi:MAG: preprotein translocase subunit SecG [Chloroflexi bacterium]|nr:MAG: preprotein translocase subunit SecG [Chloroflexota bacterium]